MCRSLYPCGDLRVIKILTSTCLCTNRAGFRTRWFCPPAIRCQRWRRETEGGEREREEEEEGRLRGERTCEIWKVLSEKSCGYQRKVDMS